MSLSSLKTIMYGDHERCKYTDRHLIVYLKNLSTTEFDQNSVDHFLRRLYTNIHTFTNADECVNYITSVDIHERDIILFITEPWAKEMIPMLHPVSKIRSIYILLDGGINYPTEDASVNSSYRKVKVYTNNLGKIAEELKRGDVDENDFTTRSTSNTIEFNNQQEALFMYAQLLKEIFVELDKKEGERANFISFCRRTYIDNKFILDVVDEFEKNYCSKDAIKWYTRPIFLYSLLNQALRTHNINILLLLHFFIRDLEKQLQQAHQEYQLTSQSVLKVYRGQGMGFEEFNIKLKNNIGGLLSLTTYWSTSCDPNVADIFVEQDPHKVAILFEITLYPGVAVTRSPFASIRAWSELPDEEEYLFSLGSVFRIINVSYESLTSVWKVSLTLTDDDDEQLRLVTQQIRDEMSRDISSRYGGWHRIGYLMCRMSELDKALTIYQSLLEQASSPEELAELHYQHGFIYEEKGDDLDRALWHYKQMLTTCSNYLPPDNPLVPNAYSGIGSVLQLKGDIDGALIEFQRALDIDLNASEPRYLTVATRYSNLGFAYMYKRNLDEGLRNLELCLDIQLKHLPPLHASIATTLNNIAAVYCARKDFEKALDYLKRVLEIEQKSLPPNHHRLSMTHHGIAYILGPIGLHQYGEAVMHARRALEIALNNFTPHNHRVQECQNLLAEIESQLQ